MFSLVWALIPVCLWFLAKNKVAKGYRDRRGELLFIDARKLGVMADRTHKEFAEEDISMIADTYHAWRGQAEAGQFEDVKGFCKSATLGGIGYVNKILVCIFAIYLRKANYMNKQLSRNP